MLNALVAKLSDVAKARVRTLWPYLVGALATWLVAHIKPLHIDSVTATVAVGWVLGTIIYEAGKWLSARPGTSRGTSVARWFGRWMLSLGLPIPPATYPAHTPAAPATAPTAPTTPSTPQ